MTTAREYVFAPYGAFELKRLYQRHMMAGTLISASLPLMILAILVLLGALGGMHETPIAPAEDDPIVLRELPSPGLLNETPISQDVRVEKPKIPGIGVPEPVEDHLVTEIVVVPTLKDKEKLASAGDADVDIGQYGSGEIDVNEIFGNPAPDEFIPRDEEPVLLSAPAPHYPEMARAAGVEGEVWVKILIDTEGKVIDAFVLKESGVNAGFEESSLAAAWNRVYRPAMQNDQPVKVWISYRVRFQLK